MQIDIVDFDIPEYRVSLYNYISKNTKCKIHIHTYEKRAGDLEPDIEKIEFEMSSHSCVRYKMEGASLYDIRLNVSIPMVLDILLGEADSVILPGYGSLSAQLLLLLLRFSNKKSILWVRSFRNKDSAEYILKRWKRILIHSADRYVVPGAKSQRYLRTVGVEERSIFKIGNPICNNKFRTRKVPEKKNGLKLIYVGRLNRRKGVDILLKAFKEIRRDDISLDVFGRGALKGIVEKMSRKRRRLTYHGFVDRKKLPSIYTNFDTLVLPSRYDLWGLVINEAMNAGLSIICSEYCGAAEDIVRDGYNGLILDELCPTALSEAFLHLAEHDSLRAKMSHNSYELISDWGFERAKRGFMSAVCDN